MWHLSLNFTEFPPQMYCISYINISNISLAVRDWAIRWPLLWEEIVMQFCLFQPAPLLNSHLDLKSQYFETPKCPFLQWIYHYLSCPLSLKVIFTQSIDWTLKTGLTAPKEKSLVRQVAQKPFHKSTASDRARTEFSERPVYKPLRQPEDILSSFTFLYVLVIH